jgi:prolyl oligopeptidase
MEGENNAKFQSWLGERGSATRAALDASPIRTRWGERLKGAGSDTRLHRLQRPVAGRLFFLRAEHGQEGVLMVRDADNHERVLFDPNALAAESGHARITEYSASPDGKLVAINVDHGGSEVTRIHVLDVLTGAARPDVIEAVWGEFEAIWLPDSTVFTYTQLAPEPEQPDHDLLQNQRVRLHRLGTQVASDPVLLKSGSNARMPFEPREFPFVSPSAASDWSLGLLEGARPEARVCIVRTAQALSPAAPWNCIVEYQDQVSGTDLHGSTLYLLSTKGAPNGRVLAVDLEQPRPSLARARVVLAEASDTVTTAIVTARDALYVRRMKDGIDTLVRIPHGSTQAQSLPMPFAGTINVISADPRADGIVFELQSWTRPNAAFRFDPAVNTPVDLKLGTTAPADYGDIQAIEAEAPSADGTRVPLTIVARKDSVRDGTSIAILRGYGAYGISARPRFDPLILEWVKAGHVWAEAHVRGGGEKGDAWRLGGKGALKYKGVEDFIGCARELVRLKVTSPDRIAALGGSAGGLIVGGAITRAPDQFGAAIITAGVLNPARLLAAKNGLNNIGELADPRTPDGLKILAAMDPYLHIRNGVSYPAVMLIVGLNDNRVVPWNSGKFGARLAAATRSGKPVWYRTDADMGHVGTALTANAAKSADTYAFIEMQMK